MPLSIFFFSQLVVFFKACDAGFASSAGVCCAPDPKWTLLCGDLVKAKHRLQAPATLRRPALTSLTRMWSAAPC